MGEARWLDEREARVWRGMIGVLLRLTAVLERCAPSRGAGGSTRVLLVSVIKMVVFPVGSRRRSCRVRASRDWWMRDSIPLL